MKLLLFVAGIFSSAVLANDFQKSCRTIKIQDQYLSAVCETTRGTEICSQVDLSECLLNVNGEIKFVNDLEKGETGFPYYDERNEEESTRTGCSRCRSASEPFILHCDACPDGRTNVPQEAWYDLSEVVDNQDGWLVCFRTRGTAKTLDFCLDRDVDMYDE